MVFVNNVHCDFFTSSKSYQLKRNLQMIINRGGLVIVAMRQLPRDFFFFKCEAFFEDCVAFERYFLKI
jgi:hypothetical protein